MKKITLLSIAASAILFAGGDFVLVEDQSVNYENQESINKKLEEMKETRNIISITPTLHDFSLNIGDEISIKIERENKLLNYLKTGRILSKNIKFISGIPQIELEFSTISRKIASHKNILADFQKRIARLEK